MSRRAHILLLVVAAVACVVAPPLTVFGVGGPLRVAASLAVLTLAPGMAITGARRPAALELGLVLATSLACSTVAAQGMLALGLWAPRAAICVMAALSLPLVAIRIYGMSECEPQALSGSEH